METPIVIDACSLINLLRIDEEDNFLYKYLKSLNIHIAEIVYKEFKKNIFKNALDDNDKKRLRIIVPRPQTDFHFHEDDEIQRDIGKECFEMMISYIGHRKKLNGELLSSLLSLVLCRTEEVKISFYTDDIRAKNEFDGFFKIQQIGSIEDSVDLLIMLFWMKEDFTIHKLKDKLSDLKSEYIRVIKFFVDRIEELKRNYIPRHQVWKKLDGIVCSFYENDMKKFYDYVEDIRRIKDKEVKKCMNDFPNLPNQPWLANKVDQVLKELGNVDIYKLV